jgi:hypothetical protein
LLASPSLTRENFERRQMLFINVINKNLQEQNFRNGEIDIGIWKSISIDLLGSIYLFSFNIMMSHTATPFFFPMFGFSENLFWD